jgi:predicted amidohydrolase YtcJ
MSRMALFNAHVVAIDPATPKAEMIVVEGNRILFVGNNKDIGDWKQAGCEMIDCKGMTLIPGFIDAHCHLFAYAESLVSLKLSPDALVFSISDMQRLIHEDCQNKPPGTLIRGKGYNEFYLLEKRHPSRWDLDTIAPLHPVKLTHRSGHAHVLNSLALREAGISAETGDPPGGLIERDLETGEPTGLLFGMGRYLTERMAFLKDSELERGMKLANDKILSCGITSIQDASPANDLARWNRLDSWIMNGVLKPRISMMVGFERYSESGLFRCNACAENLKLGGVKIIADQITGSLHPDQKELNEMLDSINQAELQAAIHAIEEPVIEAACNAIEHALTLHPRQDHRHRIEHCSNCSPRLLRKLQKASVSIVTQPSFVYYSGDRYLATVAEEIRENLYPIGSMHRNGLRIGFSSDFPIVDPNPLVGIQAAVIRKSEGGADVSSRESIGLFDALSMYTMGAASANFEEGIKGSLTPGKLADIVALNENPFDKNPEDLTDIRAMMTIVGGRIVWSSPAM